MNPKVVVLIEKPVGGLPPLLVMGVAEENQMLQVRDWINEYPERRGCVFTERLPVQSDMTKKIKKLSLICVVLAAACLGRITHPSAVHAQATSPAYTCPFGNGGVGSTYPCVQYIVEISTARLGGGINVFLVKSNPVDVSTLDEVMATTGSLSSGASVQEPLPDNQGGTFTISVSKP